MEQTLSPPGPSQPPSSGTPAPHTSPHAGGNSKNPLQQLEDVLSEYLVKKAPYTLPPNIKETLVKFAPWLTIIVFVISLPLLLLAFGLSSFADRLMFLGGGYYGIGFSWTLHLWLMVFAMALELLALPGLFKRTKSAWKLLFYSVLVSFVAGLFNFSVGQLLGTILSFYFLFQVKELYK